MRNRTRTPITISAFLIISAPALGTPELTDNTSDQEEANDALSDDLAHEDMLTPYRSNYFIFDVYEDDVGMAKFQLSIKARLLKKSSGKYQPYLGFTQKCRWDLFGSSSPFEESNYSPELFLLRHFDWGQLQFGYAHESNGMAGPDSRSWDRLYVEPTLTYPRAGEDYDFFTIKLRLWPVSNVSSDNPDIRDFYGLGELHAEYRLKRAAVAMTGRLGDGGKGSLMTHLAYAPWTDRHYLRLYMQVWTGYGEWLIDYDQKDSDIRLGLMLGPVRAGSTLR